ncbi:L-dopachrome tautomerase-related protein [Prosthecobacter sp.]|uniref:L-dopachrome tautomerase-related protein n=1 Tax=Prosthecobacter sp. TaxID=1965333 RepID=UPI003783ECE9
MKAFTSLLISAALAAPLASAQEKPVLREVASFPSQQVTGVAVSKNGRVFVNFPFWSDEHVISVAELLSDGTLKPYPDAIWNAKEGAPQFRWVCVQSVVVDDTDALWVLDPAAPKTEKIVPRGPKLVKIDLHTNKPVQTISFDESVAPGHSYLNDVRIDTEFGYAYMTESGEGALVVADLKTGKARRLLAGHPSTKAEADVSVTVEGLKVIDPKTGKAPAIKADGIALDELAGWLYYHPLAGATLYRIKTSFLRDAGLSEEELAAKVEKLATTPKPDGMLEGPEGTVYLTAIEENGIARYNPGTGKTTLVMQDPRLKWPDTLAHGPDGWLYVTTSQIHRMPKYHGGKSMQEGPFHVFRLKLP